MAGRAVTHVETVALGAGPANLSLAALHPYHDSVAIIERRERAAWHDSLLFQSARMQTIWLKDLVSLVDPTNEYSFLNYAVKEGRLYSILAAQFESLPRLEFSRYLEWAADRLGNVQFGHSVYEVAYCENENYRFRVTSRTSDAQWFCNSVVFGVGTRSMSSRDFGIDQHEKIVCAEHLLRSIEEGRIGRSSTVVVVGTGQTGADCVLELLEHGYQQIRWVGQESWITPLDDSCVANEFYRPAYGTWFQQASKATRTRLVAEQTRTSDGVMESTLRQIYQLNYCASLASDHWPLTIYPGWRLIGAKPDSGGVVRCQFDASERREHLDAELLVLAAGRMPSSLPLAESLSERLLYEDHELQVSDDYTLCWKDGTRAPIFVQNRSRLRHGVADPNLSLLAVRSACIVNSLLGKDVYRVEDRADYLRW